MSVTNHYAVHLSCSSE